MFRFINLTREHVKYFRGKVKKMS